MKNQQKYTITGVPNFVSKEDNAVFLSRIDRAYNDLCASVSNIQDIQTISIIPSKKENKRTGTLTDEVKKESLETHSSLSVKTRKPSFAFEQLVLPDNVIDELKNAIQLLLVEKKVFDEWGLRKIEPNPKTSLNFYGPPGTGKTMAAHAICSFLGKNIMIASYADIESKYHGDGPKNVKSLFMAAEQEDAVLFIDEADSLLSKRLTNVTQGSEQAINSMRSQLLISLEQFKGVIIFATNLIKNYDKAFETRVRHIEFPMPDEVCRLRIWQQHLPDELPLNQDVDIPKLACQVDDICGRDIRNAVIYAAVKAAISNKIVGHEDLLKQVNFIKNSRIEDLKVTRERNLTEEEKKKMGNAIKDALGR